MYRDALIFNLPDDQYLISTCDSCGSIGEKQHDVLKIPPKIVGNLTAKVAIMEALSLNAIPTQMILSISNESEPTANKVIAGAKDAINEVLSIWDYKSISELNFRENPTSDNFPILISTETNMSTSMTALGVVINAISKAPKLDMPQIGDNIYMIGIPSIGNEVIENQDKILNLNTLKHLISQKQIRQIIPAGSGGINAELLGILNNMDNKNIKFNILKDTYGDLIKKSSGPATSALIFAPYIDDNNINIPIHKIGNIELM